ncbi:hypothetical protein NC651_022172 [Populus alba x Populus x berolinensis]|nr:hypothetical protein NC651_022172 [Populus alba x Populus x berolinensis]
MGEAMEYETDGYRLLAPECCQFAIVPRFHDVIAYVDNETTSTLVIQRISTETWMSNAYSFGMVVWEHGDRRGCLSCIHHLCRQQLTKRSPRELPANPNISDDQVLEQYPHQSALSSLKFYQFCFRPSNQYQ